MINNGRGVLFNQGDDPFVHSQQEMVMNSVFRWLDNQQSRGGMETRFDLNKECDLPETHEVTARIYREMYDRNPIAGRVVEAMPEECWKSFPTVYEDDDPDTKTEFEEVLDEIRKTLRGEQSWYVGEEGDPLWSVCHRADVEAGIGHYGIILIGTDDGRLLSEPAPGFEDEEKRGNTAFVNNLSTDSNGSSSNKRKNNKRSKLLFLSVFGEDSISAVTYETDKHSPRYRKPKMYSVNLGMDDVGIASTRGGGAENVHWSRVIHIPSQPIGSDIIGVPLQRPVWNNLLGLQRIYAIDPVSLWQNVVKTRWLSTLPQLGGDVTVDESSLKEMLWNIRNGLQRDGILKGMTATTEPISLADPGPHINVQIEAICIKLPMPKRIFMGSERGELSSGQDSDQWDDVVRGKRGKRCIPYIVVPLHDRLIRMGVLPSPKEGYKVDWEDPSEMSPMEKADLAAKRTDTLAKYVGGNVSSVIDPLDFLSRIIGMEEEEATEILERAQEGSSGGAEGTQPPAVDEQGNLIPPTDPATGQPTAPVEETRLNGAQITAAKDILLSVSAGGTPASVATELLVAVGINRDLATRMASDASKHSIDAKKADVLESDTPTEKSEKKAQGKPPEPEGGSTPPQPSKAQGTQGKSQDGEEEQDPEKE